MTYQEFTRYLKLQTETLSYDKQIDLAIEICKKLFFDYQQFSARNNWGNSDSVLDTIKFIEQFKNSKNDNGLLKAKIIEIESIMPDTEDFGDASCALNSCVAVCETLQFMMDNNAEHIYAIGTCLTDTIDVKIQEDADLKQEEIDNHPEMIEARKLLIERSR